MKFLQSKAFCIDSDNVDIIGKGENNGYILLHFQSEVTVSFLDTKITAPPYSCLLVRSKVPIHLSSSEQILYDWFETDVALKEILDKYEFKLNTIYTTFPSHKPISQSIQSIEEEHIKQNHFYAELCELLAERIIILIARLSHSPNQHISEGRKKLFLEIRAKIHADYAKKWTVADMAELANLSSSRFLYWYKQIIGISPLKDLEHERLRRASLMLINTNCSVEQCAIACGYSDQYHFTRQYKRYHQETPGFTKKKA